MPEKTTARRARTVERRVQHLSIQFFSEEMGFDGERVQTVRTATRGQLVVLPLAEAARLDSLAAEGASVEDINRDIEAAYAIYQNYRREIPDGI